MIVFRKYFFVLVFLTIIPALCGCGKQSKLPQASAGVMDLTGWDFRQHGIAELSGQWAFYPNQLLSPKDPAASVPPIAGYVDVPSFHIRGKAGSRHFGGKAHATLRLQLKLPKDAPALTLMVRNPKSACRLWVDGKPAVEDGVAGESWETEVPGRRMAAFIPLDATGPDGRTVELLLQVSSYHGDPVGGVRRSVSDPPYTWRINGIL